MPDDLLKPSVERSANIGMILYIIATTHNTMFACGLLYLSYMVLIYHNLDLKVNATLPA